MAEKRVKLTVPMLGPKEEGNLEIYINGKSYVIPRGVTVEVPECVAEEYARAEAAKNFMLAEQRRRVELAAQTQQT